MNALRHVTLQIHLILVSDLGRPKTVQPSRKLPIFMAQ